MKKILLLAFAVLAFAACTNDDETPVPEPNPGVEPGPEDPEEPVNGDVISFEPAEAMMDVNGDAIVLGTAEVVYSGVTNHSAQHVFWPKPLAFAMGQTDDYDQIYWQGPYIYSADGVASLGAYYDDGTLWDTSTGTKITDTWGGFLLSQNYNMTAIDALTSNQFAVWAASGANKTSTFAVGYDSNSAGAGWLQPKEYNAPQIDFSHKVAPARVFLANSTYTYAYFQGKAGDKLVVKITGWDGTTEGKSIECVLIDGAKKEADWVAVNLTSLGSVDKLTFTVVASDAMAPFYFCLDELSYE